MLFLCRDRIIFVRTLRWGLIALAVGGISLWEHGWLQLLGSSRAPSVGAAACICGLQDFIDKNASAKTDQKQEWREEVLNARKSMLTVSGFHRQERLFQDRPQAGVAREGFEREEPHDDQKSEQHLLLSYVNSNSISRMCDIQHFVVFHRDGGRVESEWTGQRTHIMYTMSAWTRAKAPLAHAVEQSKSNTESADGPLPRRMSSRENWSGADHR